MCRLRSVLRQDHLCPNSSMGLFVHFALHVCRDLTVMMRAKGLQGCPKSTAVLLDYQQLWQPTRNGVLSTLRFVLQQDSFHQTKHDRPTMRLCCTLTVALTVACCLSCCSCLEHVKTRCIVGCHSRFLKTMSGCYSIVISTPRQDVPCYHQNLL